MMLNLWKIEEGACYVDEATRIYVIWSLLQYSSKMFWGCETIQKLDKAKELSDRTFNYDPEAYSELLHLLQQIESPLLDSVRIIICFENYFKAMLLLENYVIHQMDKDFCQKNLRQFLTNGPHNRLLQETTPISISEVLQAEVHDIGSIEPLKSLKTQTIGIGTLLKKPKYKAIFAKSNKTCDKLFPLLERLNFNRNSLHFLTIEYISIGGFSFNNFIFLRDYVSTQIETFGENFYKEKKDLIELGKMEIESFDPEEM